MQLRDYVMFARRWGPSALLAALAAALLSYGVTRLIVAPTYTASVTMEVQLGATTNVNGIQPTNDVQFAQTEAGVAAQIPTIKAAFRWARRQLPEDSADDKLDRDNITCAASAQTSLFTCSVTAHEPGFAAMFANALGKIFIAQEQAWTHSRYHSMVLRVLAQERYTRGTLTHDQDQLTLLRSDHTATSSEIAAMISKVNADQGRYDALVQTENGIRQVSMQQSNMVRMVGPATVPQAPSRPHPLLNASVAFLAVLSLILGFGAIRERLDDGVRGEDELKQLSGLPILGLIPSGEGRWSGSGLFRAPAEQKDSAVDESFRALRTGLLFGQDKPQPRTLLISSALEGEGKSTVAADLAAALAEVGRSVILVDLDLRRADLSTHFRAERGFADLLKGRETRVERALVPTAIPGLRVLGAGSLPPNPAELLSTPPARRLLAQLTELADTVIIDSPPLLPVTDGAVLAALCDATILVVRPSCITRHALSRARETLVEMGAGVLGIVVNAVSPGAGGYRQYHARSRGPLVADISAPARRSSRPVPLERTARR